MIWDRTCWLSSTLQEADEVYLAAERKGLVKAADQFFWRQVVGNMGLNYFASRQLEAAKRCLLYIARYHKERREWVEMTNCSGEALALCPEFIESNEIVQERESELLILLADAPEEQGGFRRAREYDEKADANGTVQKGIGTTERQGGAESQKSCTPSGRYLGRVG